MKLRNTLPLFLAFFLPGLHSHGQDQCLQKFFWLNGAWKAGHETTVIVEEWHNGLSALEGKSYEVRGKDTLVTEYMSIRCVGGQYFFTYHPVLKGEEDKRKPVDFILVSDKDDTYVFENKMHDFPQRVIYQQQKDGKCHAWIEGTANGKYRKIDFFYSRMR